MDRLPANPALEHLTRTLRADPMWESGQILKSRADWLGIETGEFDPAQQAANAAAKKAALRAKLDKVRNNLWTSTAEATFRRIDRLPLDGQPELQATADRMRTIAAAIPSLPMLALDKHYDADFFAQLQRVLASSLQERAAIREHVNAAFADRNLRKRGKRMIKLLRREAPGLYQLESEWLDRLLQERKMIISTAPAAPANDPNRIDPTADYGSQPVVRDRDSGFARFGCLWWFIAISILRALATLGGAAGE